MGGAETTVSVGAVRERITIRAGGPKLLRGKLFHTLQGQVRRYFGVVVHGSKIPGT